MTTALTTISTYRLRPCNARKSRDITFFSDRTPTYLASFEQFLLWRDKVVTLPGYDHVGKTMHYTFGMVNTVYNFFFNGILHLVGNSVDDGQVLGRGNPDTNGSTDPSHSQLAKDHDNHLFHVLAATLAKEAVRKVGMTLDARWGGNTTSDPAGAAATFIVHPMDSNWQDSIVTNWERSHPQEIKRGASSTEWEALRKEHEAEMREQVESVRKRSKGLWNYINENYETIFGEKSQVTK
jgi:hypothetical protein